MSPFMLLVLLVVVFIAFVVVIYNKMIKMRNHADEAWSDIDVQLKRRYNLIPNIIETVKGYATHEESVFVKVTEARSNAINAGNLKEQAQAENMLSGALKSLFAVAENYPDLKANENFMQLQTELVDTEDKIQAARRFYNGTVRDFNTKLQQFPNSMIAKTFKFEDKEFFEIEDEEEKEVVAVSFAKSAEAMPTGRQAEGEGGKKKKEEAPTAEVPAEPAAEEKPAEEAALAEPEATEEKTPEAETPAEPAKCPKCGGEMTEGHTCPMPAEEEKPAAAEAPPTSVGDKPAPTPSQAAPVQPTPPAPADAVQPTQGPSDKPKRKRRRRRRKRKPQDIPVRQDTQVDTTSKSEPLKLIKKTAKPAEAESEVQDKKEGETSFDDLTKGDEIEFYLD